MNPTELKLHLRRSVVTVLRQHWLLVLMLAGVILAGTAVALVPPLVLERVINQLTTGQAVLFSLAFAYFIFLALAGILESLQTVLITLIGQKITRHKNLSPVGSIRSRSFIC